MLAFPAFASFYFLKIIYEIALSGIVVLISVVWRQAFLASQKGSLALHLFCCI